MTTSLDRSVWRTAIVSAMVVAAASSTAFAQAQDEAFKRGMDARKSMKWLDVAAAMQRAIDIDPKESRRRIGRVIGLGGDEYLPYFRLGEALFARGDCAGALTAWEQSDRQRVARGVGSTGSVIVSGYTQCEAKGFLLEENLAQEVEASSNLYRAVNDVYQELRQDMKAHPGVRVDAAAQSSAQAQIAAAYEKLVSGQRTRLKKDFIELRSWLESANGTIRKERQVIAAAVAAGEAFKQRVTDADSALQQVDTQLRDLDATLTSTTPLRVTPSEGVSADRAAAGARLASARDKLRNAVRNQGDVDLMDATRMANEATALIDRARSQFELDVSAAVGSEIENLQLHAVGLTAQIDERVRNIEDKLRQHPEAGDRSAEFTKLQAGVARARRSMDRSVKARELPGVQAAAAALTELGSQLDSLAARLGIAATPDVPAALWNAARALFENRYADVLDVLSLDEAGSIPMPLRIHAHLIRSAALFALYEYSGASDDTLRRRAREEADLGRSLDPAFRPGPAFSPRFINFFLAAPEAAR